MKKLISIILFLTLIALLPSCSQSQEKQPLSQYEDQIGDTPFDPNLDDENFKFCDADNVLHKRALIRYKGGMKAFEEALLKKYESKPEYSSFTGFFIIRFAVNCKDEAGRYRMQVFDSDFKLTECPSDLENHILSSVKELKGWQHPFYDGKPHDGYKFINIKIVNGQIEKL